MCAIIGRVEGRRPEGLDGSRGQFFDQAEEFTPLLAVDSKGSRSVVGSKGPRFVFSTEDHTVGRSLFLKGARGEMGMLANAVAILETLEQGHWVDGTIFLDLGANIGTSTITALCSHAFGEAIACEPDLENYRLLKVNAVINDVDDLVRALPVAVSDKPGAATLAMHARNSGGHHVIADSGGRGSTDTVVVEKVTVNYLVERGILDPRHMGLVWIDAQGHEGHIVKGASLLVERGTPIVLEYHPGMLASAGGLAMLEEIIAESYTHFVDLRRARVTDRPLFELHPAADIAHFTEGFGNHPSGRNFTDILTLRLDLSTQEEEALLAPVGS